MVEKIDIESKYRLLHIKNVMKYRNYSSYFPSREILAVHAWRSRRLFYNRDEEKDRIFLSKLRWSLFGCV